MDHTVLKEVHDMKKLIIKCGGSVYEKLPTSFYEDIVTLQKSGQYQPIIVHGGGPYITTTLKKHGVNTSFHEGLRVTSSEVLDIVEMVLSGTVNKQIVASLKKAKGNAFGLSGVDGQLVKAAPISANNPLGFVGEVKSVQTDIVDHLIKQRYIPVISPLGIDDDGQKYNINGDIAAAAIAQELNANLCFISDIPGIQVEEAGVTTVLKTASHQQIERMIAEEKIKGGMLPKVNAALDSLKNGVSEAIILNGLDPNSLLDYVNGREVGTKITLDKEESFYAT